MPADPEAILAHVTLLRITDRLLDVADELREARDTMQTILERHSEKAGRPPAAPTRKGVARAV